MDSWVSLTRLNRETDRKISRKASQELEGQWDKAIGCVLYQNLKVSTEVLSLLTVT